MFKNERQRKKVMMGYKDQLRQGIKIESEHKPTFRKIEHTLERTGKLPEYKEIEKWIAQDHLNEFPNYYLPGLVDLEKKLANQNKMSINIEDVQMGDDIETLGSQAEIIRKIPDGKHWAKVTDKEGNIKYIIGDTLEEVIQEKLKYEG